MSSDRNQPLQIEADRVEYDAEHGVSTYIGKVRFTRGSILLTADRLVLNHDGQAVRQVVATGSPVNYRQLSDRRQEIRAHALRMEYHADTGELLLLKQAELHQDANVFASERIVYDSVADKVMAGAGPASPQDRVRITIQPGAAPQAPQ